MIDALEDTSFLVCITSYNGEEVAAPRADLDPQSARSSIEKADSGPVVGEDATPYFDIEVFKWDAPPSSIYPVTLMKPAAAPPNSIPLLTNALLTTRVYKIPAGYDFLLIH